MNCVGVARDGREARFPALGPITGDWGGGADLGSEALFAPRAARTDAVRGRCSKRACRRISASTTPSEVAHAIHRGQLSRAAADGARAARLRARGRRRGRRGDRRPARRRDRRVRARRVDAASASRRRCSTSCSAAGCCSDAEPSLVARSRRGCISRRPAPSCGRRRAPAIVGSALLVLDELGAATTRSSGRGSELERRNRHDRRTRWLRFGTSRRRASIRAPTARRSMRSTSRSATASSSCSSGRRGRARRRRSGCSPGSRRSTPARSSSASATSPTSRRRIATSRWSSRTTRSTRT